MLNIFSKIKSVFNRVQKITTVFSMSQELAVRTKLINSSTWPSVIYLYSNQLPLHSTFRYRGYNMVQTLNKTTSFTASYFFIEEIDDPLLTKLLTAKVWVIVRMPYSHKLAEIINLAKTKGIKIVYDIDDLIFIPKLTKQVQQFVAATPDKFAYWEEYINLRNQTARLADYFITTNQLLADELTKQYHKKSFVIPNFLNDEQIEVSQNLYKHADLKQIRRLGYFSGSNTHDNDLELIAKSITKILENYPKINLTVVGFITLPHVLEKYKQSNRIVVKGFTDYLKLQEEYASVDLLLVPLQKSIFTDVKSELKFFEAAIVGTPGIFSSTFVYDNVINGKNGLLANVDEWYQKIDAMIKNPVQYNSIKKAAKVYAFKHYTGSEISAKIIQILTQILNS